MPTMMMTISIRPQKASLNATAISPQPCHSPLGMFLMRAMM